MPDRVTDTGGDRVDCSLSAAAAPGGYNVSMSYSNLANGVGSLEMSGTLTQDQTSELQINFQSNAFFLTTSASAQASPCMARAKVVNPEGAIWIDNLSCPNLRDPMSPAIACVASGGLIFENCN